MKTIFDLKRDFEEAKNAYVNVEKFFLRKAGTEAVKWIKQNFKNQNYNDEEDWSERPEWVNEVYDDHPSYKGSDVNGENPLLLQTRKLRDAVEYTVIGRGVEIGINTNEILYAIIQNEGGMSYWPELGRQINVQKRKFIPVGDDSIPESLIQKIKKKYEYERDKAFNKFKK